MYYYTAGGVKSEAFETRDALEASLQSAGLERGQGYYITEVRGTPAWMKSDFECTDCGHVHEQLFSPTAGFDKVCPQCGEQNVIKKISASTLMTVAIADGVKRNESMQLTVRGMQLKAASYKVPPSQRQDHDREINSLQQKAKEALEKGK